MNELNSGDPRRIPSGIGHAESIIQQIQELDQVSNSISRPSIQDELLETPSDSASAEIAQVKAF